MTNYQTEMTGRASNNQGMRTSMRFTSGKIAAAMAALGLAMGSESFADMGRTAGSWGVSPSGAATYSIPIWEPPGPKGMQPSMSFSYNSLDGNGSLGVGWSLSGFSSIERCPWTAAEDGQDRAVAVASSDRFCLDGNKLRITSGPLANYGSTGAVYQTQVANFSRVTSVGAVASPGSGPISWLVHTKGGLILEYGNSADSRVVPGGAANQTVLRWMLNKVSDRDGNSYAITYTTDNTIGRVPSTVSWGRTSAGIFQYQAAFNYSDKSNPKDFVTAKQGTVTLTNKLRLDSVTVGYSSSGSSYATKRQYLLHYDPSPTTDLSRLTEIKECAATQSNCLKPTAIAYQNGAAGLASTPTVPVSTGGTLVGNFDFNGDGRTDVAYANGSTWRVAFSTGSGATAGVDTGITATPLAGRFVPSHQDGLLTNVSGTWRYVGYNGVSFATTATGIPVASGTSTYVTDYNGDGLQDLVWAGTTSGTSFIYLRLNTTTGAATVPTFSSTIYTPLATTAAGLAIIPYSTCPTERICDINGDGAADLSAVVTTLSCGRFGCTATSNQYDVLTSGSGYFLANSSGTSTAPFIGFRFNDDRCMDTVKMNSTQLRIGSCGGGTSSTVPLPGSPVTAIDWDGDGRTDLVTTNGGTLGIYKATGQPGTPFSSLITTSIPSGCAPINYFVSDFDGDGLGELACASGSGVSYYSRNGGGSVGSPGGTNVFATQIPDLASNFLDGYGNSASPRYVSTAQSNYTKGTDTVLPLVDDTDANIVVGRMTLSDGIGTSYDLDYSYKGARRHATLGQTSAPGTGSSGNVDSDAVTGPDGQSAGFEQISVVDSRTGRKTVTRYEQLFPLTGTMKQTDNYQSDQTLIHTATRTYLPQSLDATVNNRRYFVYLSQSNNSRNEVGGSRNGLPVASSVQTYTFSDITYGNLSSTTLTVTDADQATLPSLRSSTFTKTVSLTYNPPLTSGTDWCVGLVTSVVLTDSSSLNAGADIAHTTSYPPDTANPSKCRSSGEIVEPDSSAYRVSIGYTYDSYGNISQTTVVGRQPTPTGIADMPARVSSIDWGATGQFPTVVTDASGARTNITNNFDTATIASAVDPNGLTKSFVYDGFGRVTQETAPDGTYATVGYDDCSTAAGCANALHRLTVTRTVRGTGGGVITDQTGYFDSLNRLLVSRDRTLNGLASWDSTYQWTETEYDNMGHVFKSYMPCLTASVTSTCRGAAATHAYDAVNRRVQTSRPRSASDATPQLTIYSYAGQTRTVTDALGNSIVSIWDIVNNLRQRQDANGYSMNFNYDASGSLTGITDSASVVRLSGVIYGYGIKAFQTQSVDSTLGLRTWAYNSLGEPVSWTDPNSQAANKSFKATYDVLSRPLTLTEPGTLMGDPDRVSTWVWGEDRNARNVGMLVSATSNTNGQVFSESHAYDSQGREQRITYSVPGDATSYNFDYSYDPITGTLSTLTYPVSTAGFRLGVNYAYRNGILRQVSDANAGTAFWVAGAMNAQGQLAAEQYGASIIASNDYDPVNGRLRAIKTGFAANDTALQSMSFGYDLVGNVTQRQNNKQSLTENFYYGTATDKLYRLDHSTLSDGSTQITNLALTYDSIGNILSRTTPEADPLIGRSITWSSYNYPERIVANGQQADFAYGPGRERWKMEFTSGGSTETTIYLGGLLEKVTAAGVTEYRHYIGNGNRQFATYSRKTSGGTPEIRFLFTDHQSSVESITTDTGALLGRESFSAYGERRNASTWQGAATDAGTLDSYTRKGYTFQTVLGAMGLNHMNGRVQDAVTGRFLSPDPFLFCATPQGFNRYSYVRNNPLSRLDPTGFEEDELPEITVTGHRENDANPGGGSVPTPESGPSGTDPGNTPEPADGGEIVVTGEKKKSDDPDIAEPEMIVFEFTINIDMARFERALNETKESCDRDKENCVEFVENGLLAPLAKVLGGAAGGGYRGALGGALNALGDSLGHDSMFSEGVGEGAEGASERANDGRATTRSVGRAGVAGFFGGMVQDLTMDATNDPLLAAAAGAGAEEYYRMVATGHGAKFRNKAFAKNMKSNLAQILATMILEKAAHKIADKACTDKECIYTQ